MNTVSPVWLDPLTADYRTLKVHTLPPPCEGFQFLLTLRILDGFDLRAMERNGADHVDTVWRAIRLAAGVRIAHNKPGPGALARMLSDEAVEPLRARVRDPRPVEGPTEQWVPREPDPAKEHTTSFSVADRDGNAVCVTQGLGGAFGCGVVVPGTGICLNNFLYWGEVDTRGTNPLLPGTDLALPMAPSLATRDNKAVLLLGTPGSYGICQTQTQALVQHVDFGVALQDAIEAPRARLWDGARVQVEGRLPGAVIEALRGRGHDVETTSDWSILVGGMQGIAIDPATGVLTGGADPRREGYVAVP
jgi:gamma-glutamyltranspeptidase/glutathione hydrolase